MDWTSLLYAVILVYLAYEAGRWAMRQQLHDEAQMAFFIMKTFDKMNEKRHYKNIISRNEQKWEDYEQDADDQWEEIIENDKKQKQRSFNFDKRDH
jgi:hypothetical protein